MNLSALFIRRPATTTLLTLGITVFGAMAYRELPVSDLPAVDFPTIQVQAVLPGASPDTMASSVALPLEKQFASIPGLTGMNSTSNQGSTSITLQFDLDRDIDAAAQDVQAMIGRASRSLPSQMPAPPSYQKVIRTISRSSSPRCVPRLCRYRLSTSTHSSSLRNASPPSCSSVWSRRTGS